MLGYGMVEIGQVFKNYKELCFFLGEKEKGGEGKKAQFARWQHSFSFHKEGHKIVIDEVYKDYIEDASKGNHPHVKEFLPYIMFWLAKDRIEDEYIGVQRLLKSELNLVCSELYELYNKKSNEGSELLKKHGVRNYRSFALFMYNFELMAKQTIENCFGILEKGGAMKWRPAQVFIIGENKARPVYVTGYENILDHIETVVCNEMNPGEPIGRRFLHTIKKNKHLAKKFHTICGQMIMMDEQLSMAIRDEYKNKYGEELNPYSSIEYYRLYYIESIDRQKIYKWKLDKIDSITLKKALVNPYGPEKQTLEEKVYNDIFLRMNKKNKLGIPEKDFENLIFLIHQDKLTRKNYIAKKERLQVHGTSHRKNKLSDRG